MENSSVVPEAIGRRFKAGLQSVLNGLTKDEVNGDAILGESDDEDTEMQNCDDTLLEATDSLDNLDTQPSPSCTALTTPTSHTTSSNSDHLLGNSRSANTTETVSKSGNVLKNAKALQTVKSSTASSNNETAFLKASEASGNKTIQKAVNCEKKTLSFEGKTSSNANKSDTGQAGQANPSVLNSSLKSIQSSSIDNHLCNGHDKSLEQSLLKNRKGSSAEQKNCRSVASEINSSAEVDLDSKPNSDSKKLTLVSQFSQFNGAVSTKHLLSDSQPLLSPEGARGDTNNEAISPPPLNDETIFVGNKSVKESNEKLSSSKLKRCRKDLEALSNAKASQLDGKPKVALFRNLDDASVAESPTMGRKTGKESLSRRLSADHKSDPDKDDGQMPCKKAKLSTSVVEPDDRLKKLISHLSTTLDEPSPKVVIHEIIDDDEDDGLEPIHLKKNGLASFYDAIIKSDVIKDSYHEELTQRHKELRIKNNMDSKKIQKILHEMKSVREKLKLMNIKPAQRSVSTQMSVEKLQVPLNHNGAKILKSTVLSQKALSEQRKVVESPKLLPAVTKGKDDGQIKHQFEANATRLAELAAKAAEEKARIAAAKVKSLITPKPPAKVTNSGQKVASSASSEVIDLTSEEDSEKAPPPASTPRVEQSKPLNELTKSPPVAAPRPQPHHPAPLPQCPLTGQSGDLLKPNAPRLELTSKEDGIVLQWNMTLTKSHARVSTYQIFGYKERPGPITGLEWKKVGDLKALPLPMACTLTQFQTGHKYHFAVRAVDELGRTGPFGTPRSTKLG